MHMKKSLGLKPLTYLLIKIYYFFYNYNPSSIYSLQSDGLLLPFPLPLPSKREKGDKGELPLSLPFFFPPLLPHPPKGASSSEAALLGDKGELPLSLPFFEGEREKERDREKEGRGMG